MRRDENNKFHQMNKTRDDKRHMHTYKKEQHGQADRGNHSNTQLHAYYNRNISDDVAYTTHKKDKSNPNYHRQLQSTLNSWRKNERGGTREGRSESNSNRRQLIREQRTQQEGKKKEKRKQRVQQCNGTIYPSKTPSQRVGKGSENIISFEHINVNGINPHDGFIELQHAMGVLNTMEAWVFSMVETKWDTTSPSFGRYIKETIQMKDKFAKFEFGSNMDEFFDTSWKPGGTLVGVSGKWASRVESRGTDHMGRWSWIDMRGKKEK
jgi:hypothetical protein